MAQGEYIRSPRRPYRHRLYDLIFYVYVAWDKGFGGEAYDLLAEILSLCVFGIDRSFALVEATAEEAFL